MSNFYGKRFLSSLLGALTVLGSPVASAVGGKLGKGNLKGKVGPSAGRSKNGGKGGKLGVDREVKSVDGLKEVLKETGGKVVRVSPDGKGGFVAFVKTPTGKVVTVAVVGASLLAIIAFLVLHGRKSNFVSGNEILNDSSIDNTILNNNIPPTLKNKYESPNDINNTNVNNKIPPTLKNKYESPNDINNTNVNNKIPPTLKKDALPNGNFISINNVMNSMRANVGNSMPMLNVNKPEVDNNSKKESALIKGSSINPSQISKGSSKGFKEIIINYENKPQGKNLVNSMRRLYKAPRINMEIVTPIGNGNRKSVNNYGGYKLDSNNGNELSEVRNATGTLLALFDGDQGRYNLFVDKLLKLFFKDESFEKMFNDCGGDLDEFLKLVFGTSEFDVNLNRWEVGGLYVGTFIWSKSGRLVNIAGASDLLREFFISLLDDLSKLGLVGFEVRGQEANWGDKISAMLFGFWFLAKYNLELSGPKDLAILRAENSDDLMKVFNTISKCVKENLTAAGRDENGQKLEQEFD